MEETMPEPKYIMPEQFLSQTTEALSAVNTMTARIDERVKTLVDKLDDHEEKLERIATAHQATSDRVTVLETKNGGEMKKTVENMADNLHKLEIKVAALEIHHTKNESRWGQIVDFAIKLLWCVAACAIIYKLGLSTPPLP